MPELRQFRIIRPSQFHHYGSQNLPILAPFLELKFYTRNWTIRKNGMKTNAAFAPSEPSALRQGPQNMSSLRRFAIFSCNQRMGCSNRSLATRRHRLLRKPHPCLIICDWRKNSRGHRRWWIEILRHVSSEPAYRFYKLLSRMALSDAVRLTLINEHTGRHWSPFFFFCD